MKAKQKLTEEKQRLSNQNNNTSTKCRAQSLCTEGQNEIDINGIKILFPFEPYDCQHTYMSKVIETLETGQSALLESPTGTGKTLSLLCSILGWRENLKSDPVKLKKFEMDGIDSLHKRIGIPNVIYSTRTHTQLNQVVQELKCTAYAPKIKIAILGSRDQLCVHPKISKERGSKLNTKCRSINSPTSTKKCYYKQGSKHMDSMTKNILSTHILDVEDLHLIGKDAGFCPYYHSISACNEADIIFMPYNYLISTSMRPSSVKIAGSIVIFDEAHNIQSVCCESASFELAADTLAQCISEIQSVLELNKSNAENALTSEEDLAGLKKILLNLEKVIESIDIPMRGKNEEASLVKEGKFIFEILKKAEITTADYETIIDVAQDVLRELASPEAEENVANSLKSNKNSNSSKYGLETFVSALQTIFNKTFKSDSFRTHLAIKKVNKKKTQYFVGNASQRTLSLWCFNPGIAISSLKNEVHAMILTSGTLAPLESFSHELEVAFPIRLENKHLICDKQIYVGVLEKGPCHKILSSEYTVRNTTEYVGELGNALINITRRIPYGMLVFFASYQHMTSCVEYWHKHRLGNLSIMEQFEKNKHVICEPRGGGQSAVKQVFKEYSDSIKHKGGAMLFAVMRGKISEGMDFADNAARCVVICGIPYPYFKDPRIQAKRQYMDKKYVPGGVNGQMWYQQQAVRAVNQAIGRVIRHRFDYGCIILADRRFSYSKNKNTISSWIKPYIQTVKNFGLLTRDLRVFFQNTTEFDKYMKNKSTQNKRSELFNVRKDLENITKVKDKDEIKEMMDAQQLTKNNNVCNSEQNKFKRHSRKRKYSDTLGKMSKYVSTPIDTPSNLYKKRKKMTIAYELNDELNEYSSKPTVYCTQRNNPNVNNISFHGNTPSAAQRLKRKMLKCNFTQQTQHSPQTQTQYDINKNRARKLRIENSQLTQTQTVMDIHNTNKRRKSQNKVLENVKNELTKQEYTTFKCVLKLLSSLKKSRNEKEFDENVVTPFRALFSVSKRKYLLKDLQRYIPKQFVNYYNDKLVLIDGNDKKGQHKEHYGNNKKVEQKGHYTMDETFIKLRKMQNKNADISQPINRHKRHRKKTISTKKSGYNNLCKTLMSSHHYNELQEYIKKWRGINGNDINVKSNKKKVLQNIVNIFIKSCKKQLDDGRLDNFRCLASGFDKMLAKKEDKEIYHHFIQSANEMQQHMKTFKTRQNHNK